MAFANLLLLCSLSSASINACSFFIPSSSCLTCCRSSPCYCWARCNILSFCLKISSCQCFPLRSSCCRWLDVFENGESDVLEVWEEDLAFGVVSTKDWVVFFVWGKPSMYARASFKILWFPTVTSFSHLSESVLNASGSVVFLRESRILCAYQKIWSLVFHGNKPNFQLVLTFLRYLQLPKSVAGIFHLCFFLARPWKNFFNCFCCELAVFKLSVVLKTIESRETYCFFCFVKSSYQLPGDFRRLNQSMKSGLKRNSGKEASVYQS